MITGSIVALVTPMHTDGRVDWAGLERLLDLHLASGTAAVGAVGTTGESATKMFFIFDLQPFFKHIFYHISKRK